MGRLTGGRNVALRRSWAVLCAVTAGPVTLRDLAQQCGVTPRTVRRDLETLQAVGFPITVDYTDDAHHTGLWRCLPSDFTRRVCGARTEVSA